jgi:uncharacterized protein (DUF1501 family)
MRSIARRQLLWALGAVALSPSLRLRVASAQTAPAPRTLVVVFQRGAVDGLSMVVPYAEPSYQRDRPRIAIPPPGRGDGSAIDLDGRFGLHPRLAALQPLWRSGELAVVHAVGPAEATRSHFDAQHFFEVGSFEPSRSVDGFLSRALASRPHAPTDLRGVAMGEAVPELLRGALPCVAIDDLARYGLQAARDDVRARLEGAFGELYAAGGDPIATGGRAALATAARLREVGRAAASPMNGATYPRGRVGRSLQQLAALLRAGVGVEVACVETGGWDTHTAQGDGRQGRLPGLLDELGSSLAAFHRDLGERMRDVLVLTVTEFGRTVAENGTGGTDHGHGSAVFALGGAVRGGQVLGRWPGLDPAHRLEGRDLAVTTDVRELFAEALREHMGLGDLSGVFPGYTPRRGLGLFREIAPAAVSSAMSAVPRSSDL